MRCRYWTLEQMIAHHTFGGCNLRPGDLLGTGTISSPVSTLDGRPWGRRSPVQGRGDCHQHELPTVLWSVEVCYWVQGPGGQGSLMELSWNGARPVELEGGETRSYIQDGDTVTLSGYCQGVGYRVGFGECTGRVLPAPPEIQ